MLAPSWFRFLANGLILRGSNFESESIRLALSSSDEMKFPLFSHFCLSEASGQS